MAITDNLKVATSNLPSAKAEVGIREKLPKEKRTSSGGMKKKEAASDGLKLDYKKLLRQSVGYLKDVGGG